MTGARRKRHPLKPSRLPDDRFRNSQFHATFAAVMERRTLWLVSGFAAGLLMTGIPFWLLPYNADFFADLGVRLGFVGLAVVTAMLAIGGIAGLARIFWVTLAAFPVAVMIRVIVETMQDPTDHNLWPFELIFAAVVSLVAVVPGLLIGAIVRRLSS
jgi:hypothetical protein